MAEQQYPDSNGARWEGQARPVAPDRPAFLDRTEPMGRQEREAHGGESAVEEFMASRERTSRLQSRESDGHAGTTAYPASIDHAQQWATGNVAPPSAATGEAHTGDPELAAVSGMDSSRPVAPPQPPAPPQAPGHYAANQQAYQPPQSPPPQSPPPQAAPPQSPPPQPPPPPPPPPRGYAEHATPGADLNEPTQMHNPVSPNTSAAQRGRSYSSSAADQSSKSGLGPLIWIAAIVMVLPIAYMLVRHLVAGGPPDPGAIVSGTFALAGLPLTAYGVQASISAGAPTEPHGWLRAPYVYLFVGVALIVAAGF